MFGVAAPLLQRQPVGRLGEFTTVIVEIEAERIAGHLQRGLLHPHIATRFDLAEGEVVAQPIGKEILPGLTGFDVAEGFDDVRCGRFDAVGGHKQWAFLAGRHRAFQLDILF